MVMDIDTLILGAGYSGLIMQKKLNSLGVCDSIILERGYSHGKGNKDYITVSKNKFPYATKEINVATINHSSGAMDFHKEFSKKVYNRDLELDIVFKPGLGATSYELDNEGLMSESKIYGNVNVEHIDIHNKVVTCSFTNTAKIAKINYKRLVSTIALHEFCKLADVDPLNQFHMFISHFPIGVKEYRAEESCDGIIIEYYSDPNIPYYRKQFYGNSIFYEYCLNKPHIDKFDRIISPGKFTDIDPQTYALFIESFVEKGIWFAGRFATWDTKFQLEDIWNTTDRKTGEALNILYEDLK